MISVIMQSYLGEYKYSTKNKEQKILRAIESLKNQTYKDWELIVVSDGCIRTTKIVKNVLSEQIKLVEIEKQKMFSGQPRNIGIGIANGDIICYLDTDDVLGENHLQIINDNFINNDWIYFNDLVYNKKLCIFAEREINLDSNTKNRIGTSNIAHKKNINSKWGNGYGNDDFNFITTMKKNHNKFSKIQTPEYFVCHIPEYDKLNYYDI